MAAPNHKPIIDTQGSERIFNNISSTWSSKMAFTSSKKENIMIDLPHPSMEARRRSIDETPFTAATVSSLLTHPTSPTSQETVLYLAYGSNLSATTFKGMRGIQPLSSVNVLVPTLELSFDLAGIPYSEPCFANTRIRNPTKIPGTPGVPLPRDGWYKGLVGVVYEVTKADYATIIATEGGGASYQDIVVPCFEIPTGTRSVNPWPTTTPFKAHTLFQPPPQPGSKVPNWTQRPDLDYAQPSARYLKLIADGAEEHDLPADYLRYLNNLKPYMITTKKQAIGKVVFSAVWMPVILVVLGLGKLFADKNGKSPGWLVGVSGMAFNGAWMSYDLIFKSIFGDGERTQEPEDESLNLLDEKRMLLKSPV